MNKKIYHSDDGFWKVKAKYIVKEKQQHSLFSLQKKIFKLVVILLFIKLYKELCKVQVQGASDWHTFHFLWYYHSSFARTVSNA